MTRLMLAVAILPLAACAAEPEEAATPTIEDAAVIAASQPVAQAFQVALQSQLVEAMNAGGPMQAVEVCHVAAPRIAAEQSEASGAEVRRISDRNRNPDGAVTQDLAPHYAMLAAAPLVDGAPANVVWQSGEGEAARVNFLSAIPMREQPCSACHGKDIAPELQARIAELYPADLATGFVSGELRGALLVSWPTSRFSE